MPTPLSVTLTSTQSDAWPAMWGGHLAYAQHDPRHGMGVDLWGDAGVGLGVAHTPGRTLISAHLIGDLECVLALALKGDPFPGEPRMQRGIGLEDDPLAAPPPAAPRPQ